MKVNLKLDRKRIERGLLFRELAAKCHIRTTTLSRLVNGHADPHPRTLASLCAALDATPEEIGFSGREVNYE